MENQVSQAQFEADAHASQIRSSCLEIVQIMEGNLSGREKQEAIDEYLEALRACGVFPGMHVGEPEEAFSNPGTLAEFVAGQILAHADAGLLMEHMITNYTHAFLGAE